MVCQEEITKNFFKLFLAIRLRLCYTIYVRKRRDKLMIYFDLDNTIVDLYNVDGWLDSLRKEDVSPYVKAKGMVNLSHLARTLNKAKAKGNKIGIISWCSKNSSSAYLKKVASAKKEWLKIHLPSVEWDRVEIVAYGTPKETFKQDGDVLFDDEPLNRKNWGKGAYSEKEIFKFFVDK
jgi:hypothetical protein